MTSRLLSRPLLALACLALLAPVAASAADPTPAPVAAPSGPAPVAATPSEPAAPPPTYTPSRTYTPPATVAPSGPSAAERAAAQRAQRQAKARKAAAARRLRHQLQLLAATQTHTEAVLRAEFAAARQSDAVDQLAGSVSEMIGAAPAGDLPRAATSSAGSGGGGPSVPLPAVMLAACAALLGIGAAFASRRGAGFATAALPILALLLAGI